MFDYSIFKIMSIIFVATNIKGTAANCTKSLIPDTAFYPLSLDRIEVFIRSQLITPETLNQIAETEEKAIKEILKSQETESEYAHAEIDVLVQKDGFKLEAHEVITEDHYVLTVHRIIGNNSVNGKPIFLYHGLFLSSIDWITVGIENSVAYFLTSIGFDVWLGNARGTKYGRKNEKVSPECAEFWDFSFHEVGVIDLPAMIDYVLSETGQESLAFVGHSQGSNEVFVLCSERSDYNEKFDKIISLGTFSYLFHTRSPVFRIPSGAPGVLHTLTSLLGIFEIPSDMTSPLAAFLIHKIEDIICSDKKIPKLLCSSLLFPIFGYDLANLNLANLSLIIGHFPGGLSVKQFIHYLQLVVTGKYRQFDMGENKNLEVYNQTSPPFYNLKNVIAPTYVFYSNADAVVVLKDYISLINDLPNVVQSYLIPNYSHVDFIWSKNLKTDIHPILSEILTKA